MQVLAGKKIIYLFIYFQSLLSFCTSVWKDHLGTTVVLFGSGAVVVLCFFTGQHLGTTDILFAWGAVVLPLVFKCPYFSILDTTVVLFGWGVVERG